MTDIKGPFGLWKFPLLNMLVQLLGSRGTRTGFPQPRVVQRAALTDKVTQNNEETWDLVRDERGRLANVVVHRKVTQNEGSP